MRKTLTQEEIESVKIELLNSRSPKRRSAAKKIGKFLIVELGDELSKAYKKKRLDTRTWETQVEMITSLGKIRYSPILEEFASIIKEHSNNRPRIVHSAALAYVRITRSNKNDATPILEMMRYDDKAILNGSISALTFDDMIPSLEQTKQILEAIKEKENYLDALYLRGTFDPRQYILSAVSLWDRTNIDVETFIQSCLNNNHLNSIPGLFEKVNKGKKIYFE